MSTFKSDFLRTLQDRGYIKQTTHEAELDAYCSTGVPMAYIGFDATAESLHVGSLVQIMLLRRLQQAGGNWPVAVGAPNEMQSKLVPGRDMGKSGRSDAAQHEW